MAKVYLMSGLMLAAGLMAACSTKEPGPDVKPDAPVQEAKTDAAPVLPSVVRDGETYSFEDWYGTPAPSALIACSGEFEWRLPISGQCVGAVDYDTLPKFIVDQEPVGCAWVNTEADFADKALRFRALGCSDAMTTLDYGGGARAAELTYVMSASHGEAFKDKVAVRLMEYWQDDTFRLKETIPEESADQCEIRPAGEGYPTTALVIAAKADYPTADCGAYAVGGETDNFWVVGKELVMAFSLPSDGWDIDPTSFELVTPQ